MVRSLEARYATGVLILSSLLAFLPAHAQALPRDDSPVLVLGSALGDFLGTSVDDIAVYRWNAATQAFEPIPFQLDQRVDEVFNPGTPTEFTETICDIYHEDDGLLDANDELSFLFGDAGVHAPSNGAWVDGAGDTRIELQVTSSVPGQASVTRWAYAFEGTALPRSSVSYVSWNGQADSPVVTPVMTVGFEGPWLTTSFSIAPPCGSGLDLIDRLKGRATTTGSVQEDEEAWNGGSQFLGGVVGPIRAVRYVRGAASGVNTIHSDIVYRSRWRLDVHLRVHPLGDASLYFDWLPLPDAAFFSPSAPAGVPVDGVPDAVSSTLVPWTVTRSQDGGLAVVEDVPPNPLVQSRTAVYRDDASYNDQIPQDPDYADDDDSAYGDSGIKVSGLDDSTVQAIDISFLMYPLCGGVGDASTGEGYRQFFDNPLQLATVPEERSLGPVETLSVERDASDLVLSWQVVPGATSYEVLSSDTPSRPPDSWTYLGETAAPTWRDTGAAGGPANVYYSVVAVGPGGEGEW